MYAFNIALVFLSVLCFLLKISTGGSEFAFVGGVISILLFFATSRKLAPFALIVCAAVGFYIFLFGFINNSIEGRNYFLYYFYFLSSLSLAISIRRLRVDYAVSQTLLIVSLLWFIYQVAHLGYNPDAYNDLIDGSRNFISGYMIIFMVYYLYACKLYEKNIFIFYPILITLSCFILYGRSGIALSLVVLCLSILTKYGKVYVLLIFAVAVVIGISYAIEISTLIQSSNFAHGVESERSLMLAQYLDSINSPYDILFGVDFFKCCDLIARFDGNPHNTFIMLHARFGIFPFLLFIAFYIHQFISGFIIKYWYFNVLAMIVIIRYALDQFGLFGPADFILFSILISTVQGQKITSKEKLNLIGKS
ncbi:hypothetical protein [Aeromonas bivalvium]|uniref:hypothetical protein n=1 Tax=Aeromonas bivalvium TaxID=440079 RepID=UPI0038D1BCE7